MKSFTATATAAAASDDGFAAEHSHPSFFKLYLPEHNSVQLNLPLRFIGNFNGKIPKNISLKNESGKIWPAKLAYIDNMLCITDGWKRYAQDHKLERGEFVVFSYIQRSTFVLTIYSSDGMLKNEPQETGTTTGSATFVDDVPDVARVGNMRFYKTFNKKLKNHVTVPKHIIDACGEMRLPQTIKLTNENGKGISIELRRAPDRVVIGYAGLPRFWRKLGAEEGHQLLFEVVCGHGNRIKRIIVTRRGY